MLVSKHRRGTMSWSGDNTTIRNWCFCDVFDRLLYATPEQHTGVENCAVHGPVRTSVPDVLRFGTESFERAATWCLIALVGNQCAARNAVMRANHATGQNAF